MTRRFLVVAIAAIACGSGACRSSGGAPLYPAGSKEDDGHGLLARASARLMTSEDEDPGGPDDPDERARRRERYEGSTYGGARRSSGRSQGGTTYGGYQVVPWVNPTAPVERRYTPRAGLTGSIEGVIKWAGPIPQRVATSCGTIEPLAVGSDRSIAGVVVYIDHVSVGRVVPQSDDEERSPPIGGVIVKRGCSLVPAVQLVTPLPAALAIHGDDKRTKLVTTGAGSPPRPFELLEGGKHVVQTPVGLTRVEDPDGAIAPAWVLGIDSPYYAVTDDHGWFRIDELAPGSYKLNVLHAPIATQAQGKLSYRAPITIQRSFKIEARRPVRMDIVLDR
jgi:hypothetical protein